MEKGTKEIDYPKKKKKVTKELIDFWVKNRKSTIEFE